jgi:hypothetical protein
MRAATTRTLAVLLFAVALALSPAYADATPTPSPGIPFLFAASGSQPANQWACALNLAASPGFGSAVKTFQAISESDPGQLRSTYQVIYVAPGLNSEDYGFLQQMVAENGTIERFVSFGGVAVIDVAGTHGDQPGIAPDDVGFSAATAHDSETIAAAPHPYITGKGFGGAILGAADFESWQHTDLGTLTDWPQDATIVLQNSDGPSWIEYQHGPGRVIVTTLTYCWDTEPNSKLAAASNLLLLSHFYSGLGTTPTPTPTTTPTPAPTGAPCSSPDMCLSGNCVDGVCCNVAACPAGQICNYSLLLGECHQIGHLSDPCTVNSDCDTDYCFGGHCAVPPTSTPTATPSQTATPTPTLTGTPTSTPTPLGPNDPCSITSQCRTGLVCNNNSVCCVSPTCPQGWSCDANGCVEPTPTLTPTNTPGPNDCCDCGSFCAAPVIGTCAGCTTVFDAACNGRNLCVPHTATATVTSTPTATADPTVTPTSTPTFTPTALPPDSCCQHDSGYPACGPPVNGECGPGGTPVLNAVCLASGSCATPTPPVMACVGDCTNDGHVTVDDILTMVNITLGNADVSSCEAGDANHDGQITVDEILAAVDNVLNGCRV